MENEEFKNWRTRMGFTQQQAADALDLSLSAVVNYEKGVRRDDGAPVEIPFSVMTTCLGLERKKMAKALIEEKLVSNRPGGITAKDMRDVLIGLVELEIRPTDVAGKKMAKALIEEKLVSNRPGGITAKDMRETLIGIFELA
jgi:DNA-binding XRE family transcriptional regulator